MKRRDFVLGSAGVVSALAARNSLAGVPCTPTPFAATGGTSIASSCTPGTAPAWFASMGDKTWSTVARTGTLATVDPRAALSGTGGQADALAAWGGACIDTQRQALVIPAQGGHTNYGGNEVYELVLNTATPAWARLTNPRSALGSGSAMDDGSPRATHGESHVVYAANVDRVFITGMAYTWQQGNTDADLYAFNRSTLSWSRKTSMPAAWSGDNVYVDGGGVYDPTTGYVWILGTQASSNGISRYNPTTDTHTLFAGSLQQGYDTSLALAASRGIVVCLNGSSVADGDFVWLDLNNLGPAWRHPAAVTGTPVRQRGSNLVWHGPSNAFIAWGSGTGLFKLTPPANPVTGTWVWSSVAAAAGNAVTPSAPQAMGTYGRFNIIDNLGGSGQSCLVLVNAVDQATYVYKLPAAGI